LHLDISKYFYLLNEWKRIVVQTYIVEHLESTDV